MSITMQGAWTVSVKAKNAKYPQRFVISGAAGGNGTYASTSGPVIAYGAGWAIAIEHDPGTGFKPSRMQLKFPTATPTEYRMDVQSDDAGTAGDGDFDDLVLTCAMAKTATDFLVYGHVSYYTGRCGYNPCWKDTLVIDSYRGLELALRNELVRKPLEQLYPERLEERPLPIGPIPPRPPFRAMMVPLQGETSMPAKLAQVVTLRQADVAQSTVKAAQRGAQVATVSSVQSIALQHGAAKMATYDQRAIARLKDRLGLLCERGPLPGVALRFQEYDRTAAELAGGAYTGSGDREDLGGAATDRNGNYVFRFSRSIADIVDESTDVPVGSDAVVQARPDLLVRMVDPSSPTGYCYESGLYANVPLLRRIDICLPKSSIGGLPTACEGGPAIKAIGDVVVRAPQADGSRMLLGGTLDASGRVTVATSDIVANCAVWAGRLRLHACFLDQHVTHYTIRWQRDGAGEVFFQELLRHPTVIGAASSDPFYVGDKVGPFDTSLRVDGLAPVTVPAYLNIESDSDWTLFDRDLKAVINSWLYAPASTPGRVTFRIDGYDAAGLPVASDHVTLYIDNSTPVLSIASVSMGAQDGGDCALFEIPPTQLDAPLEVRFKATHADVDSPSVDSGYFQSYTLSYRKGNAGTETTLVSVAPHANPITGTWDGVRTPCSLFTGTHGDPTADADGYVIADVSPVGGWLTAEQPFCTFAIRLGATIRITDGRDTGVLDVGTIEYLLGIQQAS